MTDRATKQFLRWRDRGDADALAGLFDRTAPELLRVGLHLTGNLADAEDLLQATFLAAIESAARFERSRRVVPWLVAILTHSAQAERRRQRRAPANGVDGDAGAGRHADPAQAAAERELADASLQALDALPEPYRQPTMLRVAHGLEPTAIALLLGRSPGAVRVQIHRGLEQVRRRMPVGALAAFGFEGAGRGLAAVKSVVLSHALASKAAAAATGGVALLTGGVIMSKKTLALAALLLTGLAAVIGLATIGGEPAARGDATPTVVAAVQANAEATKPAATQTAAPLTAPERTVAAYDAGPDAWHLRARVVDAATKAPIAGAAVELFAPRSITLLELQREFGDYGNPTRNGTMYSRIAWLRTPENLDAGVVAGGMRRPLLVPPAVDQAPLVTGKTDSQGSFELQVPPTGSVLAVSFADHGQRLLPIDRVDAIPACIELWPLRRLVGEVRTAAGEVPGCPLQLLLTPSDSGQQTRDAWLTTTDAAGGFTAEVAADRVMVSCRTRGWALVQNIIDPKTRYSTSHSRSLDVAAGGTVYVVRYGCATLHVTDAASHEPIETIWVTSRTASGGSRYCGEFCAPDGYFALSPEDAGFELDGISIQGESGRRTEATVWSNGYAPTRVESVQLFSAEPPTIEVRLQRGDLHPLDGTIMRSGKPLAGIRTQLRFFDRSNPQRDTDLFVATAKTARDGSFRLAAPGGEYLLEVVAEARLLLRQPVALPATEPLLLDLDSQVWVAVEVVDEHGSPVANHNVDVRDEGGRGWSGRTGTDGRATFGPFDPGTLRARAPLVASEISWQAKVFASVDAAAGTHPLLQLRLPSRAPIHARLAFDGHAPESGFAGFVARDVSVGVVAKDVGVDADGLVPIDLLPGAELLVTGPGERQWRFTLDSDRQQDPMLYLRWSGLSYEGVLRDARGSAVAHTRVTATPVTGGTAVSALTDASGAFHLEGLEPSRHRLTFFRTTTGGGNSFLMASFATADLPSNVPVVLEPRVPTFDKGTFQGCEQVEVTGFVRDGQGKVLANTQIAIAAQIDQTGGELTVFSPSGPQTAGPDGSYRCVVARGSSYRVSSWRKTGQPSQQTVWRPESRANHLEHDIVLK